MAVALPTLNNIVVSLDGAKSAAVDLYDHVRADVWGSLYWGVIWGCTFVITFLLVRMLFTRWGDRNITMKTLGVSLLVHLLVGMISNTVVFGPGAACCRKKSRASPFPARRLRRAEFSGRSPPPAHDADPFEKRSRLPGNSPAWEQASQPEARSIDRQTTRTLESPASEIVSDPREMKAESLSISAPNLADRPQAAEPGPEALRDTGKIARPAEMTPARIAEETAQSRPDATVRSGSGTRTARGAGDTAPAATDVGMRTRAATSEDLRISADGPATASPYPGVKDPQVPSGSKGDPRGAPASAVAATPNRPLFATATPAHPPAQEFRQDEHLRARDAPDAAQQIPNRSDRDVRSARRRPAWQRPGAAGPGDRGTPDGGGGGSGAGLGDPATGLAPLRVATHRSASFPPNVMRSGSDGVDRQKLQPRPGDLIVYAPRRSGRRSPSTWGPTKNRNRLSKPACNGWRPTSGRRATGKRSRRLSAANPKS